MSSQTTAPATPVERRILRRAEVEAKTGFKRAHIYSLMKEGRFPKALRLGVRAVGWDSTEIDQWIADRSSITCCFPHSADCSARATARNMARRLLMVSSHSSAGTESATMPPPACTCSSPCLITAVRMAMAVSILPFQAQ